MNRAQRDAMRAAADTELEIAEAMARVRAIAARRR